MPFELNIKNIGKLTDAKIRIGQFTVLAGPNNTGKSFVSKVLYSLFNAMNAHPAAVHIYNLTYPLFESLENFEGNSKKRRELLSPLHDEIEMLHSLVMECPADDFEKLDEIIPDIVVRVEHLKEVFEEVYHYLQYLADDEAEEEGMLFPSSSPKDFMHDFKKSLNKLKDALFDRDADKFIASGIEYKIRENLIENFQVAKLSDLRGKEETPSEVESKSLGKFEFWNGEIEFNIHRAWFSEWQRFSNVIYLESPVYWKLKNALENVRFHSRHWRRRERLSGVPRYFYDLTSFLRYEYKGDVAFPNIYERLTGKNVLGGKIAISKNGDLSFRENDRNFPLPVTAIGVANLGILALLIERKVLDENSFIFIDEPEAHLHPAWQVVMAETLFELAKGGVHVVIATHSADILKWLEVHVKKNPDDEKLIALNKFPVNGDATDEQNFNDKISDIKQELTKPFADLYTAGL